MFKNLTEEQIIAAFNKVESETPGWRQQSLHVYKVLISEFCRINGLTAESAEQREQRQAVASIYITPSGEREFDDWKCSLPVGRNILYTTASTPPAGVPNVFDMASDMQVAIANGDLPDQCEAAADWLVKTFAAPQPEDIPAIFKEQAS